jgi:hypothetical protein
VVVAALSADELPDEVWRRPSDRPPDSADPAADQRYQGPPPTTPPAPDWQPPLLLAVAPPRRLPTLDDYAIDDDEEQARRLTYRFGYGAVTVLLIVALARLAF